MDIARRIVLVVLDGCGCGDAPDAAAYGDRGANTLGNIGRVCGGLTLPHLEALGLGNLAQIDGVSAVDAPLASFGRLRERSAGKDTMTGHWELAGLELTKPFQTFPHGLPSDLIERFSRETCRGVLGNKAASGTEIIAELGAEHLASGKWIVYTSADSVMQIAAHLDIVPLNELYAACERARSLCDLLKIGRVIARPFAGDIGSFHRTSGRRDYGMPPTGETILDQIVASGREVVSVGKIADIFSGRGISRSYRTRDNREGMDKTIEGLSSLDAGLVFVNLVDFDSLYGHRRDPTGFAGALEAFDGELPRLSEALTLDDILIISADHGNDPTFGGTDHTREEVPLLVFGSGLTPSPLGIRDGFMDVAATISDAFGGFASRGTSFWATMTR